MATKRVKTSHNTGLPSKENKKVSDQKDKLIFLGEYFNIHTFQKAPVTANFFLREAHALKEWSEKEDSLQISEFYTTRGYSSKTFYQWVDNHEVMQHAFEYALCKVGARRELGVMNRRFEPATVHRTLGYYHDVWRKETQILQEQKAALIAKHSEDPKVVIIERFPTIGESSQDLEVVSMSSANPEALAANIKRNTATDRIVKVRRDYLDEVEGDE